MSSLISDVWLDNDVVRRGVCKSASRIFAILDIKHLLPRFKSRIRIYKKKIQIGPAVIRIKTRQRAVRLTNRICQVSDQAIVVLTEDWTNVAF